MSAPEIPNLLASLRGGRGRGRGGGLRGLRGGGGGISERGGHWSSPSGSRRPQSDLDVQATDSDAAGSRMSAVSLGYLEDEFAGLFSSGGGVVRRMPVINRGTYARTSALDILVNAFLAGSTAEEGKGVRRQIISLGAGTDTRYFRLRKKGKQKGLVYHEFDFPDVSMLKYGIVERRGELKDGGEGQTLFKDTIEEGNTAGMDEPEWGFEKEVDGGKRVEYCFHPMDLRKLPYGNGRKITKFKGIRDDVPTLIISECCLCYLEVDTARDVIDFFTSQIQSIGIILYEPIGSQSAFGQTMATNLAARNIIMPTVREYKDLADQKRRLKELGFGGEDGGCEAVDIERVWEEWVPEEEKRRVDGLEGLDEVEEWQVIARHYAVVWGWRGDGKGGWSEWERLGWQEKS